MFFAFVDKTFNLLSPIIVFTWKGCYNFKYYYVSGSGKRFSMSLVSRLLTPIQSVAYSYIRSVHYKTINQQSRKIHMKNICIKVITNLISSLSCKPM